MKIFIAAKLAIFATSLLKSAGFDLEAMHKAGDVEALKTAIDQLKAGQAKDPEMETALEEAVAENTQLKADLAVTKKEAAEAAQVRLAVETAAGIKISDCRDDKGQFQAEKLSKSYEASVAKASRIALTRAGVPAIDDGPTERTRKEKVDDGKRKGRDRYVGHLNRAARALNARDAENN